MWPIMPTPYYSSSIPSVDMSSHFMYVQMSEGSPISADDPCPGDERDFAAEEDIREVDDRGSDHHIDP